MVQSLKQLIIIYYCFLLLVVLCKIISLADSKLANYGERAFGDRRNLVGRPIGLEARGELVGAGRGERRKNYSRKSFQYACSDLKASAL